MDDNDDLPPAEAARGKRRDRDADARARAGMRTGLAKQFKQVLDAQRKRADETERPSAPDEGPSTGEAEDPRARRRRP